MPVYRFAEFEVDGEQFELRREGRPVKVERIPLELLFLLLQKKGGVASREEIVERLWGREIFLDTEHGINTAIRKIRQALRDNAETPRYIQTVTSKGYRFLAPFETTESAEAEPVTPPPAAEPAIAPKQGWRREWVTAIALCVAGVALAIFTAQAIRARVFASRARKIHSIAVLPLVNLSGDPAQEYFADGLTDELITDLAKQRSLRVVSRTSVMQYKGARRPVREIAQELGVDGVLEGSVARTGERVHMTAQLIYAPTDTHVWAESYDRDFSNAFSLPEELSETVAKEVQTATSPVPTAKPINPEAHDAYLRGRYFWMAHDVEQSQAYFEKAVQLEPDYAAAWSGLADTYALEGMGWQKPEAVTSKAKDAAERALALDGSLAEAHNSMGAWYFFYGWDPERADAEFRRATELNPSYAEAHYLRAWVLAALDQNDAGEAEMRRYVEMAPFARPRALGVFLYSIRKYDAAISELEVQQKAHPSDEDSVVLQLSTLYWLKGRYADSQAALEKGLRLERNETDAAAAHAAWVRGGEKAVEEWGVQNMEAQERKGFVSPLFMADAYSYAGAREKVLRELGEAYRVHDPNLILLQTNPLYDFVHEEPRYQALVKKLGLRPEW